MFQHTLFSTTERQAFATIKDHEEDLEEALILQHSHVKAVKMGLDTLDKVVEPNGMDDSAMKEGAKEYESQLFRMQDAINSGDPNRMNDKVLDWKPKSH